MCLSFPLLIVTDNKLSTRFTFMANAYVRSPNTKLKALKDFKMKKIGNAIDHFRYIKIQLDSEA